MATTRPSTPRGLGPKGGAFWRRIVKDYDLAVHEEFILEQACQEIDLIARLEKEVSNVLPIVKGSKDQDIANPLLVEIRHHRATVLQLVKAIKLPVDAGEPKNPRSARGQAAANARWQRNGA